MKPNILELIAKLGSSTHDPLFVQWLESIRVYEPPLLAEEMEDYEDDPGTAEDEAIENQVVRAEFIGCYLEFLPYPEYKMQYDEPGVKSGMILWQITLMSEGAHDFPEFEGNLPLGIKWGMNLLEVRSKLGLEYSSRSIRGQIVDKYLIDKKVIFDISYENSSLYSIHMHLPNYYDKKEYKLINPAPVKPISPSFSELLNLLNTPITQTHTFEEVLKLNNFDTSFESEYDELFNSNGLVLYFDGNGRRRKMSGFRLNRRGHFESEGYDNELPYALNFADNIDTVRKKLSGLGIKQEDAEDDDDESLYVAFNIKSKLHTIIVTCSLIYNQLVLITAMKNK